MKLNLYLISIIFLFSSCVKEYEEYTFSGKFLNGTTGKPYKNIQVDFTARAPGYPSNRVLDLGTAITNENGEFNLKYSIESKFPGLLSVAFRDPNNPFIDLAILSGQPLMTDQYQTIYVPDSLTLKLNFSTGNSLQNNDSLFVQIGPEYGISLAFSKSDLDRLSNQYTIRKDRIGVKLYWERKSNDTTISNIEYLNIQGDPFIDSVTINY